MPEYPNLDELFDPKTEPDYEPGKDHPEPELRERMKQLMEECNRPNFNRVKNMNSKEKLAQTLLNYLNENMSDIPPEDTRVVQINNMIKKAKEGFYSYYDSPLATPCIQLVKDLGALGLEELKVRAMNGEFDATQEESDAWYEREGKALALEITGGNEEIADALFGKTKEETETKEGIKGWDI